jgi:hypothetical protein
MFEYPVHGPGNHFCLLAGGSVRSEIYANGVLRGLLGVAGLLGDNNNTTVRSGLHTNSLLWEVRYLSLSSSHR